MSYNQGGVSYLSKSQNYNLFLIGGTNGSISIYKDPK